MSFFQAGQETVPDQFNSRGWRALYKLGGAASILMVLIILTQFALFIAWPPPLEGGIVDWFKLFQENWLAGLVSFELLMTVYVILSLIVALALFVSLNRYNPSLMIVFLALSIVGVISFVSARPSFEMLFLSNHYAAAATEAEKAIFLAAGESMLAAFHGTSFHISYILGSISGLFVSITILQSTVFSKKTAYIRIASSIFDFGLYLPTIGLYISIFSVFFLLFWNILIAKRLFELGRS